MIELMIVVAIIGILAAIAIPAYRDYTIRSQVTEGLNIAADARNHVREALADSGIPPINRLAVGMSAQPTDTSGRYVAMVAVSNGTVVITYGNQANQAIAGRTLALQPLRDADYNFSWRCGLAPVPGGVMAVAGSDDSAGLTTFTAADESDKFLPRTCR